MGTMLQCDAVRCSVLQCVAVWCSALQCVTVCCSVMQCVAVCYSVLQCDAVRCSVLQCVAVWCSALQCVTVCCSVMQCIAVCASSVPAHKRVTSVTCKAESRQTGACKLRGLFCKKAILLRLRISLNKWTWLCTWCPFYMREGDPWPRCDVSAVWCVLQCVAVCCSVLQCVAVCCLMFLLSTKQKNVS